ncbi:MAG: hypothetical protein COT73_06660 [Bdellovibrio sp. CG10_big_fil_rev_8_21_14_0_10_47_8]|nr:MAG: hypothetical protein COT73_06660 [Bdellovibrio sp. CG10_big_fil_rev_8_21_14_0_10_47_8]
MDGKRPIGDESGPSPKQLVLAAICGCTGMDVISLLRKYKQETKTFEIDAEASATEGHPVMFKEVKLKYQLSGDLDIEKIKEAVHLSMTKYCSVSAMISKAAPINYEIFLNSEKIGAGEANF